jgi:iron complex transport system substrate-binding protein
MKRLRKTLFLTLLGFFVAQRCAFAFSVIDALGRRVEFAAAPDRIVIAGRGLLMVADALYLFPEASARLVGVEKITQGRGNFLAAIDPDFGGKRIFPVNVGPEEILSARPDVVLLKSYMKTMLGEPLEMLGVKVMYLDLETPEQYERDIETLGALLQDTDRAREVTGFFRRAVQKVQFGLAASEDGPGLSGARRPGVLLLYYSDRGGSVNFNVPPAGWMQTILTEMAGGKALWKDVKAVKGWTKVGFEQIAAWDPEYIFVTSYFSDPAEVVRRLASDPNWQRLGAVKAGRLRAFPGDFYSWDQPDPRWILGLTWLAAVMHQDLFGDIDLIGEARVFYRELYRVDDETFDRRILPLLGPDVRR